jgi:hypothetical protein
LQNSGGALDQSGRRTSYSGTEAGSDGAVAAADVVQFMGAKLSHHLSHNFPLAGPRAQK